MIKLKDSDCYPMKFNLFGLKGKLVSRWFGIEIINEGLVGYGFK